MQGRKSRKSQASRRVALSSAARSRIRSLLGSSRSARRASCRIAYSLEYGIDQMEMHKDAVVRGEKVVLVDDLIATGGTAEAACRLLTQMGAEIVAACFIIDLPDLGGAKKIEKLGIPVRALMAFEGH
jgi:adenine phosphoribosyltransferase